MWEDHQAQIFAQRVDDGGQFFNTIHFQERVIHQVSDGLDPCQGRSL